MPYPIHVAALPPGHRADTFCWCRPLLSEVDPVTGSPKFVVHRTAPEPVADGPYEAQKPRWTP